VTIAYMQGLCALAAFVLLALAILIRRRRLTHDDIGPLFSTFMAASTLPVALHLSSFALLMRRDATETGFLDPYALYISGAGLILLVSSCITIWQLFAVRIGRATVSAVRADTVARMLHRQIQSQMCWTRRRRWGEDNPCSAMRGQEKTQAERSS
jgi:hypothetical protein